MGNEIELKFEVPSTAFTKIKKSRWLNTRPETIEYDTVKSVYFDTDSRKLREKQISLRIREVGDRRVQGVKSLSGSNGLSERGEWEHEINGNVPDWDAIRGTPLKKAITKKDQRKLRPVFETRVRRTVIPIEVGKSRIEVTLDQGQIRFGRKSAPICEVELELKHGDRTALFRTAKRLARVVPANLALESKADRGYELIGSPTPRRAAAIHMPPDISTEEAFKTIASSCIRHFTSNAHAVLEGDPEGVHQMRVGLRRLRAAISLFSDLLQDSQTGSIKGELKWLGNQLSPARDLDVLIKSVTVAKPQNGRKQGLDEFKGQLAREHDDAFSRVKEVVASPRYRNLVLDTVAWLETGTWTVRNDEAQRDLRAGPIHAFACKVLTRRTKKILKKAKKLESLDEQSRHKLRIAVKKLRYASDFFASVYPGKKYAKRRSAFKDVLTHLQDCLGKLNDISVHEQLSEDVARTASQKNQRGESAFAAGIITGQEQCEIAPVMKTATKAAARLTRQRRFWPA